MRIGELADRAGVSPATCRYYERHGLLPRPFRQGGQRQYDPSALARLHLIRFSKRAGLSLAEIRELLQPGPTHEHWRTLRVRKLTMLRDVARTLREQRRLLEATATCACATAEECGRLTGAPPELNRAGRC